jgi:hypothetical protein
MTYMRTLFIGALAANLVGCTSLPHFDPSAAQIASKIRSSVQFGKKIKPVAQKAVAQRAKYTVAGKKTAPLPPAQLKDKVDPVIEKAKASITAMMENPASAEFSKVKRAVKNLLDEPVDTICGYVKGKNASGGDTGEMPFLYTIRDGEGYLVNGRSFVAETVHGVLCK